MASVLIGVADPDEALLLQEVVERDGYRVFRAHDIPDCLRQAEEITPQVVITLLDAELPGGNSFDLCARLIEQNRIPVLMLVGDSQIQAAYDAGADDVMIWPMRPTMLRHRMQRILETSALRAQTERDRWYRSVIENDVTGVFRSTWEGRWLFVNQGLVNLLGYNSIEEVLALDITRDVYMYPQARAVVNNLSRPAGTFINDDVTFKRKDGTPLEVTISSRPVYDSAQNFRFFEGFIIDNTLRKQAEAALRESEGRYRLLAENLKEIIYIIGGGGVYEFITPSVYGMLGYQPDELIGTTSLEKVHPDDRHISLESFQQAMASGSAATTFVQRLQHKDGHYVWVETTIIILRDEAGMLTQVIGTGRDVSERKRMEDVLRENEAQYRLLAENMSDGVIVVQTDNRITYVSPSYDRQFGRQVGATKDMTWDAFMRLIHPEDLPTMFSKFREAITQGETRLVYTYRTLHQAGHYVWCEDHVSLNYAPDGVYSHMIVICRDITERKQAEERMLELKLEKERSEMLTQFIQDGAHEFRTPLSVITSSTHLLLRSDKFEQRERKAVQIDQQVNRINRLVEMLLTLVKLQSGNALRWQSLEFGSIIKMSCQHAATLFAGKVSMICDVPNDLPFVMGDSSFLADALQQVLDNACRFTSSGGKVTVTAGVQDEQVWVEVVDTGRGISPMDLPHIFKTFWRHDHAHTSSGFGLGLPIAYRIVQEHKGTMTLDSELGVGTRVRIVLPAA